MSSLAAPLEDFHPLYPGPWTELIQDRQTKTLAQTKKQNSSTICGLTIDKTTSGELLRVLSTILVIPFNFSQ